MNFAAAPSAAGAPDARLALSLGPRRSSAGRRTNERTNEHGTASILYPSITTRLRRLPGTFWHLVRSIVRALRIFFHRRENCFVRAKIWEKKVWTDAINSVQISSKWEPSSRFLSHLKIENSLATFGPIQPIVPGFIALYPP